MGDNTVPFVTPSDELITLLRDFTREALTAQPQDLKVFAAKYFTALAQSAAEIDLVEKSIDESFTEDHFFRFKSRLTEVADGALVTKEHIQEVAADLMLPFDATERIAQFVEEDGSFKSHQPEDVVTMAATLVSKDYIEALERLFKAYEDPSSGAVHVRQLSDVHATLIALLNDSTLVSRYGSAIHNALLSLVFDSDDATLTFDGFKDLEPVKQYLKNSTA